MKRLLLPFVALFVCGSLFAQDNTALPFPVKVGGQAAEYKAGEPFAKIAKAVAAAAEIEVGAKGEMTIINVAPVNAKNEPVPGISPAVILLQNTQKSALDKTLDGQKLKAGNYILSVVAEGKTASILLKIE